MNVYWSDVAAADLDDIFDYIARDVPYYAESFTDWLIAATDLLEDQPRIGRRVPEAGQWNKSRPPVSCVSCESMA
jgi:toxin ParE1/3/4